MRVLSYHDVVSIEKTRFDHGCARHAENIDLDFDNLRRHSRDKALTFHRHISKHISKRISVTSNNCHILPNFPLCHSFKSHPPLYPKPSLLVSFIQRGIVSSIPIPPNFPLSYFSAIPLSQSTFPITYSSLGSFSKISITLLHFFCH